VVWFSTEIWYGFQLIFTVALGHKILIAAYFIIRDKVEYKELGEDYLNNFRKDKLIAYYKKQIERLDPNLEFDKEEAA
jgi:hypothetical protein